MEVEARKSEAKGARVVTSIMLRMGIGGIDKSVLCAKGCAVYGSDYEGV